MSDSRERGKAAADALANFINSADREAQAAFVEQLTKRTRRTLQQLAFGLFLRCVKQWAKDCESDNFDARNESTCKLSFTIAKSFGDDWEYIARPFI